MRKVAYRVALLLLRAWWVVRRPVSSGVRCVLRDGDAFVLVRHTYGDRRWMLPGGRLRRGEDPVHAARREMEQELGVATAGWRALGYMGARSGWRRDEPGEHFRRHATFFLEAHVASPELRPRRGELSDAAWFTADALPPDASDALDIVRAEGWLKRRPQSAPGGAGPARGSENPA